MNRRKPCPLASRIKKLMQKDEDVGKIAQATPVLIARAMELFLTKLCAKAAEVAQSRQAKTVTTSHLKSYVMSEEMMDFLKDTVAAAPDLPAAMPDSLAPKRQRRNSAVEDVDEDGVPRALASPGEKPKRKRAAPGTGKPRGPRKKKNKDGEEEEGVEADCSYDAGDDAPEGGVKLEMPEKFKVEEGYVGGTSVNYDDEEEGGNDYGQMYSVDIKAEGIQLDLPALTDEAVQEACAAAVAALGAGNLASPVASPQPSSLIPPSKPVSLRSTHPLLMKKKGASSKIPESAAAAQPLKSPPPPPPALSILPPMPSATDGPQQTLESAGGPSPGSLQLQQPPQPPQPQQQEQQLPQAPTPTVPLVPAELTSLAHFSVASMDQDDDYDS